MSILSSEFTFKLEDPNSPGGPRFPFKGGLFLTLVLQ